MKKTFLERFLDFYDQLGTIKIGPEFIYLEVKDLFHNAWYLYIKDNFPNYSIGKKILKEVGISPRQSAMIKIEGDKSYTLNINYKNEFYQINSVERLFMDQNGIYNSKGYYDKETVKKFNKAIYAIFDKILYKELKLHNCE